MKKLYCPSKNKGKVEISISNEESTFYVEKKNMIEEKDSTIESLTTYPTKTFLNENKDIKISSEIRKTIKNKNKNAGNNLLLKFTKELSERKDKKMKRILHGVNIEGNYEEKGGGKESPIPFSPRMATSKKRRQEFMLSDETEIMAKLKFDDTEEQDMETLVFRKPKKGTSKKKKGKSLKNKIAKGVDKKEKSKK